MLLFTVVVFVILCYVRNCFEQLLIVGLNIHRKVCTDFATLIICFSVQHECIPQAILGMDIVCQAKSGMGKTAVFVLATLQQLQPEDGIVCIPTALKSVRNFVKTCYLKPITVYESFYKMLLALNTFFTDFSLFAHLCAVHF